MGTPQMATGQVPTKFSTQEGAAQQGEVGMTPNTTCRTPDTWSSRDSCDVSDFSGDTVGDRLSCATPVSTNTRTPTTQRARELQGSASEASLATECETPDDVSGACDSYDHFARSGLQSHPGYVASAHEAIGLLL